MVFKVPVALAAIVLFGFLGLAEAQSAESVSQGGALSESQVANVVLGINYFHIARCAAADGFFFIVPLDLPGVAFFLRMTPRSMRR